MIWVKLKGYEDHYFISNTGLIKSVKFGKELIKSQRKNKRGYNYINLNINGVKKTYQVHRLVAINFIPNPQNLPQVNHLDGNKSNNLVENLEWSSNTDNQKHASENGLKPYPPMLILKSKVKAIKNDEEIFFEDISYASAYFSVKLFFVYKKIVQKSLLNGYLLKFVS